MPKLIIMQPDLEPVTFELTDDSATIGRGPENSIPLDDVGCSRRQCQILKISSGFELTDMKSRNGTKVNGIKRDRHVLSDGDVIEIGKTRITFREREGAEEEVVLEDFGGTSGRRKGGDCHLVFLTGERKKDKIVLSGDRTTFGRKDSNTVVLRDNMVSSYHCEVTKEAGGYVLRDLGSTNGSAVNGEQVSETALNHGARVRLGKTSFVFVDPAMADYEQTLAHEEEAESEWGMMRAQVDFGRVKRARRASLVWLGVFVVLLGGAAWFFITMPPWLQDLLDIQQAKTVVQVRDNLLNDFSFEEGVAWTIPEGRKGGASVISGPARQGDALLSVIAPDGAVEPTVANYGGALQVVAGRSYEFSVWVRRGPKNQPAGGMIVWRIPGSETVRRISPTPWAEEGDWNQVKIVAKAPEGAVSADLGLVVMGSGSAQFDDAVFKQSGESLSFPSERIQSAGFTLDIGDAGEIAVSWSGQSLLWNGGLIALGTRGGVSTPETCFRPDAIAATGGGARLTGKLLLPDGSQLPAVIEVTPEADRLRIEYTTEGDAAGVEALGFGFQVSREYLSAGATLSGEEGAGPIHAQTDQGGVRKLILGGTGRRLSLAAAEPSRAKMVSAGGLRLALLTGPKGGTRTLELITDFTREIQGAGSLLDEALRAVASGQLGDAMLLFGRVVNEYPFDETRRPRAETEMKKLRDKAEGELGAADATFREAKDFFDVGDLEKALQGATKVAGDFAGFRPLADPAGNLVVSVKEKLDEIRSRSQEKEAERLYLRFKDFRKRNRDELAAVFLKELETRFPNSAATARAEKDLESGGPDEEGADTPDEDESGAMEENE